MVKTHNGIVSKGYNIAEKHHGKERADKDILYKQSDFTLVYKHRHKLVYKTHGKAHRQCKKKILQQKAVVYTFKHHRSSFARPFSLLPWFA